MPLRAPGGVSASVCALSNVRQAVSFSATLQYTQLTFITFQAVRAVMLVTVRAGVLERPCRYVMRSLGTVLQPAAGALGTAKALQWGIHQSIQTVMCQGAAAAVKAVQRLWLHLTRACRARQQCHFVACAS